MILKGEKEHMVHTLELGSLYLDGKPTAIETEYPSGQNISFGDTAPDMAIRWVPVNGLLIADRCLLTNISWDDLNAQDLVFGKEIKLCGFRFRVRLLKVGDKEGIANEWDTALNTVGEANALWHWDGIYFCGQDTVNKSEVCCVLRGYSSARFFNLRSSGLQFAFVGFRPALEPLSTDLPALREGQEILVIGRDGVRSRAAGRQNPVRPYHPAKGQRDSWSSFVSYIYAGWHTGC